MKTLLLSAQDKATPEIAANLIRQGELVAIPTETVYGLGANGLDEAAVTKIFEAKGRPQDNPLILHVPSAQWLSRCCEDVPPIAYELARRFWPGPLTMILRRKPIVPDATTAGLDTVAVRCPDSEITRQIIRLSGVPIAAPSANLSGKPSTTTAQHVLHDHDGNIDAIVDDGPCRGGVESTIVDLTEDRPRLLRPGGITPEQLTAVLGDLVVDKAVTAQIDKDAVVKAPGMKYRHYAPAEPVVIVAGSREKAARYIHDHFTPGDRVLCFDEELPLYAGCDDCILPVLALGGRGAVSVASNLYPDTVTALCRAYRAGDTAQARRLQADLLPLCEALFADVNPIPVKAALAGLGLCHDVLRLPLTPAGEDVRRRVRDATQKAGRPV